MATLAADVTELVGTGMLNLDAKLTGIDDEKFLTRLVEVWNFFWVQVLPYIEGVSTSSGYLSTSDIGLTRLSRRFSFPFKLILSFSRWVKHRRARVVTPRRVVWTFPRPRKSPVLTSANWFWSLFVMLLYSLASTNCRNF
jgi:hypothetical protein